jgi:hypothetical protein
MRPLFSVASGPDAAHWMHNVTIHSSYKEALQAYNAIGGTWSAAIVRIDDYGFKKGKRVLKRANQYNYGHAQAWCDMMSANLANKG